MKNETTQLIETHLTYLPATMQSAEAVALLYAIGLQESRFRYRRQRGGPARGFWQFEAIGLEEVATNIQTRGHFWHVASMMSYPDDLDFLFEALAHNDALACCAARLLLWPDPEPLPQQSDGPEIAWQYYIRRWRPGKPHRHTWDEFWGQAWSGV